MWKYLIFALLFAGSLAAQITNNVTVTGPVTPGDCIKFATQTQIQDAGSPCGTGSSTGTVTNVDTSGLATGGPITTTGTVNVAGSGSTATATTAATNLAGAATGNVVTTDGAGNVQSGGTLLSALALASSLTPSGVGLGNVTNDTQTKAAIVPNTAPAAGAILLGNSGGTAYVSVTTTGCTITSAGVVTCTPTAVGLSNVTNDAQTKAAVVPNTAPSAGQILAGNAGGTAYAPVTATGCTVSSAGAINCGTSAVTPNLYAADSGAVNAYVVTLSPAMSALTTGVIGCFKVSANNTSTTPTVNFNGLGAKTIVKFAGGPVGTADLTTAEPACVIYDGTNFLLLNPQSSTGTGKAVLANSPSFSGAFQAYNGISLVNNGICSEFGTVDSSNSAAIAATTLYSPTATGRFKISGSLIVTTAATTSSILGGTTGVVITYTDGTSSVAQSMTMAGVAQNGSFITISSGNTGNTTTTQTNLIPIYIFAKTGVAIQYAVGYTSVGGTAMVYQLHLLAESC